MAYQCPRCGGLVQRGSSTTASVAGSTAGTLLYGAFGPLNCSHCGKIAKSEFPPDVQRKLTLGSIGMVLIAAGLIAVVITLLVVFQK